MRTLYLSGIVALILFSTSFASPTITPSQRAFDLAKETIILDGHVDIPYRLQNNPESIAGRTETGDFDFNRAMEGGLNAPFMAIYVAADFQDSPGAAAQQADALISIVEGIASADPDKFAIATSPDEVEAITAAGKIALPMGMENGAPVQEDIVLLDYFYERGIRYISLAHSRANLLSDSSYDINRPNDGLSALGYKVVKRMNELGVIVDVSHISDDAFWDTMEFTDVPVMASHSSARHFTEGFERNLSDDMIRRIALEEGVVMINFGSSFLKNDWGEWRNKYRAASAKYFAEQDINDPTDEQEEMFQKKYVTEHPRPFADISDVLDHIDHVVRIAGIDHVGLGSDFDGVGDSLPTNLKDPSDLPKLVQGLIDRGYPEEDIRKILSGNALRVWRAVESAATK